MEEVYLDMKKGQMSKLARGEAVQVTPAMVGAGMAMKLKTGKLSKLMKATTMGRGMRLKLDDEEMEGCGIMKKTKRTRAKTAGVPIMTGMVEPAVRTQRYFTSMVDRILPAARPLVQIGNAQNGDLFLR